MICSTCGYDNPAGRKFCEQCGTRFSATCATCGSPVSATARFCGECGTPQTQPPIEASGNDGGPRAPASAERRVVSVLFADLVGFTTYAEQRDAEEVRETLTRYFQASSDIVGRYGGTVEKFIGDAVMAVRGVPSAHEDDAERAVRAGLDIVDAVTSLAPGVQARCGVFTGEAAVTLGARDQGMVAG